MKKLLLIPLCLLLLCSCSKKEIKPQLCGIGFTAQVEYYNEQYSFEGEISEDYTLTAVITAPKELKDLKITTNGAETRVEYNGLSYTPVEGTMPFSQVLCDFLTPIKEVAVTGALADSDGKLTIGSGVKKANLTLSPTGLPQSLEIPDERFLVTFLNLRII